jgi:hypothetical protein
VTAKGPGQELVTLRGDTWGELIANSRDAGVDVARLYAAAFGALSSIPDEVQAVANVVQAFPQAAPVAQPVQQPQAAPAPTGPMCAHGPRVYKDTVSAKGPWRRWECAIPWQRNADNSQRCPNVNA